MYILNKNWAASKAFNITLAAICFFLNSLKALIDHIEKTKLMMNFDKELLQ